VKTHRFSVQVSFYGPELFKRASSAGLCRDQQVYVDAEDWLRAEQAAENQLRQRLYRKGIAREVVQGGLIVAHRAVRLD
jgi:hypothetical protein